MAGAQARGVYWKGTDGRIYAKGIDFKGVQDITNSPQGSIGYNITRDGYYDQIADPNPGNPGGAKKSSPSSNSDYSGGGGGGSSYDAEAAAKKAEEEAQRNKLRSEITGRKDDIQSIYEALFGDLDKLIRSRDKELEDQYGGQFKKATEQYTDAIPDIETSYAALGAGDSTDQSDAKTGAKKGFDETTRTIGKNKETDKAKLGQYKNEQYAKFDVDRDAAMRQIGRAGETEDVDALRSLRNDLESNMDSARVTRATLGTDEGARGTISKLTSDNGRYEQAIGALDSILKSSMSGAVKQAAVEAVTNSAGLSAEEKKKVQETYGNVYEEQAAL